MHQLKSAVSALCVGLVLLAALDWAASAATGRAMILGHWNQAEHSTVLKNTNNGPALDLRATKGPALAVNTDKRVKHLNADQVDGMDGSDLMATRNTVYQWSAVDHVGDLAQTLPAQQPGSYLVTYSAQLTGAAGDPGNPNVISCSVAQVAVSGITVVTKRIVGETTMTSVGTPPALSGSGPVILEPGDVLQLRCSMTRKAQHWSTTALQPLTVNLLHADGTNVYVAPLGRTATLKTRTSR